MGRPRHSLQLEALSHGRGEIVIRVVIIERITAAQDRGSQERVASALIYRCARDEK